MIQAFQEKLVADGYIFTDTNQGVQHYSRATKVGAPPNKATGLKPDVFVEIDTNADTVSFIVEAHNGDSWCTASIKDMPVEYAAKHMKNMERRVVYAWRELTD